MLGAGRHERLDLVRIGHVGRLGGDLLTLPAQRRELGLRALERGGVPPAGETARAVGHERACHRETEALARSGDQRLAAGEGVAHAAGTPTRKERMAPTWPRVSRR